MGLNAWTDTIVGLGDSIVLHSKQFNELTAREKIAQYSKQYHRMSAGVVTYIIFP